MPAKKYYQMDPEEVLDDLDITEKGLSSCRSRSLWNHNPERGLYKAVMSCRL